MMDKRSVSYKLSKGFGKKGISEVAIAVILIAVALAAIGIFSVVFKSELKKNIEETASPCYGISDISRVNLLKGCYLNENEVMVEVRRDAGDSLNISSLRLIFYPDSGDSAVWRVRDGKKCSDVRRAESEYGGYCEIVKSGETARYVFDTNGIEKISDMAFSIFLENSEGEEKECVIGKASVSEKC
ncbi:MAG: DUF948 domain-containing protein [Nanoarchaeota archaeon]